MDDDANIGPRERAKRRALGMAALVAGVALAILLAALAAPRWTRLGVFFPFWMAGLGLLQAREKT